MACERAHVAQHDLLRIGVAPALGVPEILADIVPPPDRPERPVRRNPGRARQLVVPGQDLRAGWAVDHAVRQLRTVELEAGLSVDGQLVPAPPRALHVEAISRRGHVERSARAGVAHAVEPRVHPVAEEIRLHATVVESAIEGEDAARRLPGPGHLEESVDVLAAVDEALGDREGRVRGIRTDPEGAQRDPQDLRADELEVDSKIPGAVSVDAEGCGQPPGVHLEVARAGRPAEPAQKPLSLADPRGAVAQEDRAGLPLADLEAVRRWVHRQGQRSGLEACGRRFGEGPSGALCSQSAERQRAEGPSPVHGIRSITPSPTDATGLRAWQMPATLMFPAIIRPAPLPWRRLIQEPHRSGPQREGLSA